MSEYPFDEQKKELYDHGDDGRIIFESLQSIMDRVQEKTTLELQIEIIEYERLVSKRS